MTPQQQKDLSREEQQARARRRSGLLPSGTEQPKRPSPPPEPPPEPPPMRANSSSDHHSCCSDSNDCDSERIISWGDEGNQHSDGPRSDSSWEDGSFRGSHVHSYGSCDSSYDSICSEQRIQEYMNYDPYASDEESNSREDLERATNISAMRKERLPQEPPPPAEPPPAASLYSVTVRGPNRDVANYKIKERTKM